MFWQQVLQHDTDKKEILYAYRLIVSLLAQLVISSTRVAGHWARMSEQIPLTTHVTVIIARLSEAPSSSLDGQIDQVCLNKRHCQLIPFLLFIQFSVQW